MYDFVWPQSEDLTINVLYERGDTEDTLEPANMNDWTARMDIRDKDRNFILTLNSSPTVDYDQETPGDQPDTNVEIYLDAYGHILIQVPGNTTMPNHPVGDLFGPNQEKKKVVLDYDLFVKDGGNVKHQLLKGKIVVTRSATLWP